MRTTLDIDDDVLDEARRLAQLERRSLGATISELARRGLQPQVTIERTGRLRFPTFAVSADAPTITVDDVRDALADEW